MFVEIKKKMSSRIKIYAIVGTSVLMLHFILTVIYATDFLVLPRSVRQVSQAYTVPFFHQNWSMFAPEIPEHENELEYRFAQKGNWSSWRDVTAVHGFEKGSEMEYIEQSISSSLTRQIANNLIVKDGQYDFSTIQNSFDYNKALYYCLLLHEKSTGEVLRDSIQMRSKFIFTPKFGSTASDTTHYLEYPTYIVRR